MYQVHRKPGITRQVNNHPDTMTDNSLCHVCGKPAIGMQILGCCQSVVCEEHAERYLLSLSPGERLEFGACYFWRYPQPGSE